jgi:hypothetical protein
VREPLPLDLLYFIATMAAIAYQWLPPGVIAVAFALFFILVLPRQPRFVAHTAGAVLAVAVAFVVIRIVWAVPAS